MSQRNRLGYPSLPVLWLHKSAIPCLLTSSRLAGIGIEMLYTLKPRERAVSDCTPGITPSSTRYASKRDGRGRVSSRRRNGFGLCVKTVPPLLKRPDAPRRRTSHGEMADLDGGNAHAHRDALPVFAAGADAGIELQIVADGHDARQDCGPVADQGRALDGRGHLAVFNQVSFRSREDK